MPVSARINQVSIGFFGSEATGLKSLKMLLRKEGVNVKWVVFDEKSIPPRAFEGLEQKYMLNRVELKELRNVDQSNRERLEVDAIISVFSPFIINDQIIGLSRHGGFNLHPGKLPEYAGRDPVSWAIYDGSPSQGVTIHKMTSVIDGGDIVSCASFEITKDDTAYTLIGKCSVKGIELLTDLLDQAQKRGFSSLSMTKQEHSRRKYRSHFRTTDLAEDCRCDRSQLDRVRRACSLGPSNCNIQACPVVHLNGSKYFFLIDKISSAKANPGAGNVKVFNGAYLEIYCNDGLAQGTVHRID